MAGSHVLSHDLPDCIKELEEDRRSFIVGISP